MILITFLHSIVPLLVHIQHSMLNMTEKISTLTYDEEDRTGFALTQNLAFIKKGAMKRDYIRAHQDCLLYSSTMFYYSTSYNLEEIFSNFSVNIIWLNGRFDARVLKTRDSEGNLHPILTEFDTIEWKVKLTAANQCVSLGQVGAHAFRLSKERCNANLDYLCMVNLQVSQDYMKDLQDTKESYPG